jgi:hypothetical protein
MVTLESTLKKIHDWSIDRIHHLSENYPDSELYESLEDAYSIHQEFAEWLDPNKKDHDVISLEYIGDEDEGNI